MTDDTHLTTVTHGPPQNLSSCTQSAGITYFIRFPDVASEPSLLGYDHQAGLVIILWNLLSFLVLPMQLHPQKSSLDDANPTTM